MKPLGTEGQNECGRSYNAISIMHNTDSASGGETGRRKRMWTITVPLAFFCIAVCGLHLSSHVYLLTSAKAFMDFRSGFCNNDTFFAYIYSFMNRF